MMEKMYVFTNGCTPSITPDGEVIEMTNERGVTIRVSKILIRRAAAICAMSDRIDLNSNQETGNA